jgi:hypothetical protein
MLKLISLLGRQELAQIELKDVVLLYYCMVILVELIKSRGSSGSIVSEYGLDDRGSIPDGGRGFFF